MRTPITQPPEELVEPAHAKPTGSIAPLDAAIAKIESFVRTLRYPQQRAVFKDNAMRYITAFANFYRENKSLLKMKDDPTFCPSSCRIVIPLQPTPRVKESSAFKALADESAGVAKEIGIQLGKMVMKCKLLNNADKKRETIEIYSKALSNMAEILLAELDTNTYDKHALVADLLTHHQTDIIQHLSISLPDFILIYKTTNNIEKLPSTHENTPHPQPPPNKPSTTPTNITLTPPNQTTMTSTLTTTPLPNTTLHQTATTTQGQTTSDLTGDFVTANSLLNKSPSQQQRSPSLQTHSTTSPPCGPQQQPPNLPTPTPTDTNPTPDCVIRHNSFDYTDAFAEAFNDDRLAHNAATTTTQNRPNLSPIRTTLNPYAKKQNLFSFSREFTSQEIDELDTIARIENLQQESQRLTLLDSLRDTVNTMNSHPVVHNHPQTPTTHGTTNVLQSVTCNTARLDDAVSTLTTMDDSTPSSRPSVTFHPTLISNSHTTILQKLHTAVIKCFVEAQTEYISVQNSILVEAHLTRIAARQRNEQTAEATAIILHSETTTPTRTIGIAIDNRIQKNRKELEQRLKAVEQQLEQAKNRNAAIARRLNTTPAQDHQLAKDTGASTAGAATKKLASTQPHLSHQRQRWIPPPKPRNTNASPAVAEHALQPNHTAPGYAQSGGKPKPKPNTWQTRRRK